MLHLTPETFETEINRPFPVMVMFYAAWCGKCAMMKPMIESLEKKYQHKAHFFLIDIDRFPELSATYGADIIPTFIFFKGGQCMGFMQGIISQAQLEKRLRQIFRIS